MAGFQITKDGKTAAFSDQTQFLAAVDAFLQLKQDPMVSIPTHASAVFDSLKELFDRHGIEIVLTVDSDPAAIDYVIHSFVGAAVGGGLGAALGVGAIIVAAKVGQHIPYVGWVIGAGAIAGVAIGVTLGLAVTRMGLRVKFSPIDPDMLDVELIPIQEKVDAEKVEAELHKAEKAHQARVNEGLACPKCGFSFGWNSIECSHCRFGMK